MIFPDCGLYRTTTSIGSVPKNRLVYFHNHGDPGPGIYLPKSWSLNRALFSDKGTTIEDLSLIDSLEVLCEEGLYCVVDEFTCCDKNCRTYTPSLLVQLGYNGSAEAILFLPVWSDRGLSFPEKGQLIDASRIQLLSRVQIEQSPRTGPASRAEYLH